MHRIYLEHLDAASGSTALIVGDEAHHAVRVKRVREGDQVTLFDGQGLVARATISALETARRAMSLQVTIDEVHTEPLLQPTVHILTPVPKGGALEQMIDQLSQVGAASWTPLVTERSERQPRSLDRLRRTTIESAKQCGRSHLLEIRPAIPLSDAICLSCDTVVADTQGEMVKSRSTTEVALLVGPEGGWSDDEREQIAQSSACVMRCGPWIMRIETAAVVACAAMLS